MAFKIIDIWLIAAFPRIWFIMKYFVKAISSRVLISRFPTIGITSLTLKFTLIHQLLKQSKVSLQRECILRQLAKWTTYTIRSSQHLLTSDWFSRSWNIKRFIKPTDRRRWDELFDACRMEMQDDVDFTSSLPWSLSLVRFVPALSKASWCFTCLADYRRDNVKTVKVFDLNWPTVGIIEMWRTFLQYHPLRSVPLAVLA